MDIIIFQIYIYIYIYINIFGGGGGNYAGQKDKLTLSRN